MTILATTKLKIGQWLDIALNITVARPYSMSEQSPTETKFGC